MVSKLGCLAHLDADLVAHSVYNPGSQAVKDIVAEFGKEILQDTDKEEIDRKKLGALVFADRSQMAVRWTCCYSYS
jgi:dephospho-CoA kinase